MKTIIFYLKNFFRKYPELISIPVALLAWILSIDVLRLFDNTSAVFDAGVFQIPIFAIIQFFLYVSIAWLTLKVLYGTLRKYLQFEFKNEFQNLTTWQKVKLSYFVFFSLLAILAYLARTLTA
jgi:hypothetical protein